MPNLKDRLDRAYNLSEVRDKRYKDAQIVVNERNLGRLSAELCEALIEANTAHGGKNPVPHGLYFLPGDLALIQDPPAELQNVAFLEVAPADRPDPRAARLSWNETGTQATFQFTAVANLLGLAAPEGSNMRMRTQVLSDVDGLPIILLPLGENIQIEGGQRRQVAAGQQPAGGTGTPAAAATGEGTPA